MHEFSPGRLIEAIQHISALGNSVNQNNNTHLPTEDFESLLANAVFVKEQCERLDLDVGLVAAKRLIGVLGRSVNTMLAGHRSFNSIETGRLQSACQVLFVGVRDGLVARVAMAIEASNARLYQQPEPLFGPEVEAAFPGTVAEDVSEAGKCLAFDRGTACVFHLMRAMEAVVQKLGDQLEVTIVDKNNADLDWGIILSNMKTPIEAMPKGPEKDKWSEALTLLFHVEQAWRHPTMHPKETYTPEQARTVFDATDAFMRHLASLV